MTSDKEFERKEIIMDSCRCVASGFFHPSCQEPLYSPPFSERGDALFPCTPSCLPGTLDATPLLSGGS